MPNKEKTPPFHPTDEHPETPLTSAELDTADSDARVRDQREQDAEDEALRQKPQSDEEAQLGAEQARAMVDRLTRRNLEKIADRNDFKIPSESP